MLHRGRERLVCHHCAYETKIPDTCPDCAQEKSFIAYGQGVERIAEEIKTLFPQARLAVMTSDVIDSPAKAEVLVNAMTDREIDILVGTQMIAKGHHFASLALVGVIDADMGLAGGDLRAGERAYQLLHQVSGRAGRETTRGTVYLQSYLPEHPVMQALKAGDRDRYMELEAGMREDALMPPYGKLAAVIVEGQHEKEASDFARLLLQHLPGHGGSALISGSGNDPLVLGPAPAPLYRLRGRYRFRLLVKAPRAFALQEWFSAWLSGLKVPASIKMKIDMEPYSFL